VPRDYKKDKEEGSGQEKLCVEAGLNNSTVTLRVVGGDEEGTQCLVV
jgi:hypothetical protein